MSLQRVSHTAAALDGWLRHYSHHRRHAALGHKPPIAHLAERTNQIGTYTESG
jgi:transposase InsO family protein